MFMISLNNVISALILVTALGCGLMAGVFFCFIDVRDESLGSPSFRGRYRCDAVD
jgi:hypothetical protein